MRLSHTLEYFALIVIAKLVCLLPFSWATGMGDLMGRLGWALGIRRNLVLSNIAMARPDASEKELKKIGSVAARNFGRTVTEFIRYGIKNRDYFRSKTRVNGIELVREGLSKGNGAILLTGHMGAWAIYFAAVSTRGIPLSLLVGKQHNERIDEFILKLSGENIKLISKGRAAVKKIIDNLKQGQAIVMVSDQHAGNNGILVPFLGRVTPTLSLPGAFAVKHKAPVFILEGHRLEDGTHEVNLAELEVPECETPDEMKVEVVKRYNEVMGDLIRKRPEQYFWYHRRWRDSDDELVRKTEDEADRS